MDTTIHDTADADRLTSASAYPLPSSLGEALEREAQLYLSGREAACPRPIRTYLVADFEYLWDREAFAAYLQAEGRDTREEPLWPFHEIVAASWLVLRFHPGNPMPEIDPPVVMAADSADERAIVEALFAELSADPFACLVTWGGEAKDIAVLRRCAATHDLLLPQQLRDGSPHARTRLDLCRATTVQARPVHLPELAMAVGIPAKPSPSKWIGRLVEEGRWPDVRDQVLADVLTTTVLAVRHLASHGEIACHRADTMTALAAVAAESVPASSFMRRSFAPWARATAARSRLNGAILSPV